MILSNPKNMQIKSLWKVNFEGSGWTAAFRFVVNVYDRGSHKSSGLHLAREKSRKGYIIYSALINLNDQFLKKRISPLLILQESSTLSQASYNIQERKNWSGQTMK
jgi:hypothetical protein